jgi:endonuclease-3 related protein
LIDQNRLKSAVFSNGTNPFLKIFRRLFKSFGPQKWWPADSPFEVMVGAILTQNTSWIGADRAVRNILKAALLSPRKMLANRRRLPFLIRAAGYYNMKTERLVNFLKYYIGIYGGQDRNFQSVPTIRIRRELLAVKGIGPETADSILLYALKRPVFVVDAYTRRIFTRHHLFSEDLTYNDIRRLFETNLPRRPRVYNEYHALIVRLGKDFCKKNEPLCAACPLRDLFD